MTRRIEGDPLTPETRQRVAAEARASLSRDVLGKWYPAAVDPTGGFFQEFGPDWTRRPTRVKSLVYQSRLIWVAARAARFDTAAADRYKTYARHGVQFLSHILWDKSEGGLFWEVYGQGRPGRGGEKHAYGIAFAIYAASAAYRATRDPAALDLAKRTFTWLDAHAHDGKNGGYFEALSRAGRPILSSPRLFGSAEDAIGTIYGRKSMNAHIHLLEAFTELAGVWPDATVKARLREVFDIVRTRIAVPAGYLNLFFTPDWKPVSNEDSYGHDVETAYLLVEAAEALGRKDDPTAWGLAHRLVEHALRFGWTPLEGGFLDSGPPEAPATNLVKTWWVQAEGLNALLRMHERYGDRTPRCGAAFLKQWGWISRFQIDRAHGGWYPAVSMDGTPLGNKAKSDAWTDPYHQGRALMNVIGMLERSPR